jgi:hypothetical protein
VQISNSASTVTANSLPSGNTEDAQDEEKPPAVDPALNEAEHIMLDYARLVKEHTLATTGPAAIH